MKKIRWKGGYYNRILLFSSVISLVFIFLLSFTLSYVAGQLNVHQQLQKNSVELTLICDYFNSKYNAFTSIVFSLYENSEVYDLISTVMEAGSDGGIINDPFHRQKLTTTMRQLSFADQDIRSILLYSENSERMYFYDQRGNIFDRATLNHEFYDQIRQNFVGRAPTGSRIIKNVNSSYRAYGITTVLGTRTGRSTYGKLLVVYDASAIERLFRSFKNTGGIECVIVSDNGEVVFDSSNKYYGQAFTRTDLYDANGTMFNVDGADTYVIAVPNAAKHYIGLMFIPADGIKGSVNMNVFIFTMALGFALFSVLLFVISGVKATRRVNVLEDAMDNVGSNNFEYRVPIYGGGDEFDRIADRYNLMCDNLKHNIERLYVYEIKQKDAELMALQARINPHFIYNTLEAIRGRIVEDGNDEAGEMILQFASVFRYMTKSGSFLSIREELTYCKMYLNIFGFRYKDRFTVEYRIDDDILGFRIIRNLLQPVVENYFIHGFKHDRFDNKLTICGGRDGEDIVFDVIDNGRGIETEKLEELEQKLKSGTIGEGSGYGLINVNERIKHVFGSQYGLILTHSDNGGVRVTLRIGASSV